MKRSTGYLILSLVCMTFSIICFICFFTIKVMHAKNIFLIGQWAFIGIQWICIYIQVRCIKKENSREVKN